VSARTSVGILVSLMAVFVPFERVASDDRPSMTLTARGLTFPYRDAAIFALPNERVSLEVRGAAPRLRIVDERASGQVVTVAPNRWTWQAPAAPGEYELEIDGSPGSNDIEITAFVMVSASAVKHGVLNGYNIGTYPAKPLRGDPIYQPPAGFLEVTKNNGDARVSPHLRLEQFLSHQASEYPKYVVLHEGLILALELVGRALEPLKLDAKDIYIMSGFRTPFYNRAIGNVEYSLHQWGRAADIFIDHDRNGTMDDLNQDKTIDRADAQLLYDLLDRLSKTAEGNLIGGLSVYDRTATHGPFVHIDVRTRKVRW
jgi:hypothetical protein